MLIRTDAELAHHLLLSFFKTISIFVKTVALKTKNAVALANRNRHYNPDYSFE